MPFRPASAAGQFGQRLSPRGVESLGLLGEGLVIDQLFRRQLAALTAGDEASQAPFSGRRQTGLGCAN